MREFTWFPDTDSTSDTKPNVKTTKFGDGYELRVPVGLNSDPMSWSLKFTRIRTEAKDILAFLREHGGYKAFRWTNPLEESGAYVCRQWKTTQKRNGVIEVTADFEQVFEY